LESKELLFEAVTNYGYSLEYASEKLKDDKEIVLADVTNRWGQKVFESNDLNNG